MGIRGSSNSDSRIFCRNLKVAPRIYSLGCCWLSANSSGSDPTSTNKVISEGVADEDHFVLECALVV